jgi:short-subunit dehydrogenase
VRRQKLERVDENDQSKRQGSVDDRSVIRNWRRDRTGSCRSRRHQRSGRKKCSQAGWGRSKAYVCNLTNANEIEGLRFRVAAEAGVPDVLINNAGGGRWAYLEDCSYAEIDEMIAAPLHAALYVTRAFLPGMLRRGTGMIGNVTFIGAFLPWPGATGCTAARWGMRGLHEAMRADLKGTNLTTTLVAASVVETEYWRKHQTRRPTTPSWIPVLKPEEVARASLNALTRHQSTLVLPTGMLLLRALHCLVPGMIDRLMQRSTAMSRRLSC